MEGKTLEDYKKMFEKVDKDRIIEMNYELSKNLCKLYEALNIINDFIHS